jgi:hypothetical protein
MIKIKILLSVFFLLCFIGCDFVRGSIEIGGGDRSHTHSFSDWTITTPPTCEAAGQERRTCSSCDQVEARVIPRLTGSQCESTLI